MALRKGDFVQELWSRYALLPPSSILPSSSALKHKVLQYQHQARMQPQSLLYITTMTQHYEEERSLALDEEYLEGMFAKQWELQAKQPTAVSYTNLTGVEHVGKWKATSMFINRNSQLPILTLEKIEEWWDYQDFRQFLFEEQLFVKRFYNWYRRGLAPGVSYVHYDPIWSVSPLDPQYELYLYYYSITIKRLKGWRSPVPLYLIYRQTRPYHYIAFAILVLSLHQSEMLKPKQKSTVSRLSEDYWVSEVTTLEKLIKPDEIMSTSLAFTYFEVLNGIAYRLMAPFFQFILGPNAKEIIDTPVREAFKIASKAKPHPAARDEDLKK